MKKFSYHNLACLASMALAVSCSPKPRNCHQPILMMESLAKDLAKRHEWVSFGCVYSSIDADGAIYTADNIDRISYHFSDASPAFFYTKDGSAICFEVSSESIKIVNLDDNELTIYNHTEDHETDRCYRTWKGQVESAWLGNISMFFQSATPGFQPAHSISYDRQSDTTIRGVRCVHIYGKEPMSCWRQGEKKGVSQYEYHFWFDKSAGMLDSLVKIEIADSTRLYAKETYSIKDISYEDKSAFFDSVFDFGSPRYGRFSVSDEHDWLRPGVAAGHVEDGLFGFPMVNLHGDTCFLREIEGWKLLHLWCFRCGSCIRQLEKWGEEKDSLGYRLLQDKGLKILSVNYKSDNFDELKLIAEKTNSDDILYSSKGMDQFIHLPSLGYNYLLSPNNEIVFQSPFIVGESDYSALLQAKANYEKQHKPK